MNRKQIPHFLISPFSACLPLLGGLLLQSENGPPRVVACSSCIRARGLGCRVPLWVVRSAVLRLRIGNSMRNAS